MLAQLEEVRIQGSGVKDEHFDYEGKDRGYATAFRNYGIDVEVLDLRVAADRIGARAIRVELAAALDGWAKKRRSVPKKGGKSWRDLLELAQAVDPDPWRRSFRDAVERSDRQALVERSASDEIRSLPPVTVVLFAEYLVEMRGVQEAATLLRQAQQQYPGDFWINHQLVEYLVMMRPPRLEEAISFYTAAVALRPESAGARINLGVALGERGRLDEALAAFQQAVALKPDYAMAHNNVGAALRRKARFDKAISSFRRAIDLKPDFALAHHNLGIALCQQGRFDEAVAACRQAIALKPDYAMAHNHLGVALDRQGRAAEAMAAFRKAIELKPDLFMAHLNLGNLLARVGRLDEAVVALQQAADLRPDYPMVQYDLGNFLRQQGRLPEAVAAYRRAIALKPDYAEAYCNLGFALRQQGDFDEALAAAKRGHELGSRRAVWHYPSAQWIKEYQRLGELRERLPALLQGKVQPVDAAECNAYAILCYDQKRFAASARLRASFLTAAPKRADVLEDSCRYDAACAAVLAGCGEGIDAGQLDEKDRARWRKQALEWLRADLETYRHLLESGRPRDRQLVRQRLEGWQGDHDLAGLRDLAAMVRLPGEEQEACKQLWAEVQALLIKAAAAEAVDQPG
jgi:tetratricopeptide (TPR) repeat protein